MSGPASYHLHMARRFLSLAMLLLFVGCAAQHVAIAPPRPYLIHLPGIGGERRPDHRMTEGLVAGGYEGDLEIYDWTNSSPGLPSLLNHKKNLEEAEVIAHKIASFHHAQPDRPIILVGHSGGTAMAVWALERLPDDVKVDRVILLASALSPKYDLTPALRHVRKNVYHFWSNQDVTVLSTGTTIFGTIDGVKGPAAGFVGFSPPESADLRQYQKLQQFAYTGDWAEWGNTGGHIGPMSKAFAIHVLAPLVTDHSLAATRTAAPAEQR